jgi:hypothetical protein
VNAPLFSATKEAEMSKMAKLLAYLTLSLFVVSGAKADWDGVKGPHSVWYEKQEINPEAIKRLGISWKSCCNHSDVVKTRFRVDRTTYEDEWWYLDGNTWRKVPADIVHWNDPTPDGQPVLFVYQGIPTYTGATGG